jgi:hypothetical protein
LFRHALTRPDAIRFNECPNGIALDRLVRYHVSGLRVDLSDEKFFGAKFFGIPTRYYDVPFPPALNKFVLEPLKIGHQVSLVVFENPPM